MNVIHAVRLKGYATFKDVEFKIRPGLSVIYGLNRSGGKASKNSNGVGKSALCYSIPEILYEEPVVGEKQDRSKDGEKALSFTSYKGQRIVIHRKASGRSEKLNVKVDGKDAQFRTAKYAKAFLRKAFPLTNEDYTTYVHIDSRVPHPLVMGNSAARKSFFTKFFGLDKIDVERKLYIAELAKLKRVRAAFDELRTQYDRLKGQLLSAEDEQRYARLENKYKKEAKALQDEFTSIQETLRLIQFAESSIKEIQELQNACGGEVTTEAFEEVEKQNRWDLKDSQEKLEHAENWEQYQRDRAEYDKAYSGLGKSTKRLLDKLGLDRVRERAAINYDKRLQVSSKLSVLAKAMSDLKDKIDTDLPPKVEAPEEDEGDLETLRRAYKHQLEHASKFKRGKCETCGQIVKIKDPSVLKTKLEAVVRKLNAHRKAEAYTEAVERQREARLTYKKNKRIYDELKVEEEQLLKWQTVHSEVRDLPSQPKAFKGLKLQVVVCKRMVEEIQERRSLLKYIKPHLQTIIEFFQLSKSDVKKARESSGLNEQMNAVQDKWSKVKTKLELHRTIREQVADMRTRLVKMKKQLQEEEPLQHLVKGYQDKNIKRMAIEAISERLMVLVNRYAQKVFPERFSFSFVWDTQIRMLVHRHYGKKVKTSDVRKLSGAESTLFTLILVCALLAFVPSHKRCNVLILDEPAARLSKELQEVFKNLLTILNQLIPSIIVVTPHDELYEKANAFTVIKDGKGDSTIVEGSPHEIK